MINEFIAGQKKINLKCDLAGEFPIYIYWDKNSNLLLYSKSIVKLLEDP